MSKFSQEVEVAFKVAQSQEECEKLLIEGGYELISRTETHDLYFTNQKLNEDMTEQELKFACVRFRHSGGRCRFHNFKLFEENAEFGFECDLNKAAEIIVQLKKAGFKKVFDTFKSDYVYKKGSACHQLQNIKGLGLLDYFYDENIFNKPPEKQFEILKTEMQNLGFGLEFEEGVDKLRALLSGRLCFSKNQNGTYF